ncbi:cation channel sperm-associated auxiliary subunit epsilon [Sorex araneus]|uniref:cation channel sperm-associated auxiliary subunit epsilon n=1 Tax=Sorex araneus TaxID=42254 RepID=UPI002433FD72|nr:cation channel sperm-associated auxiliary subunit epsilon [Sorex araneus]
MPGAHGGEGRVSEDEVAPSMRGAEVALPGTLWGPLFRTQVSNFALATGAGEEEHFSRITRQLTLGLLLRRCWKGIPVTAKTSSLLAGKLLNDFNSSTQVVFIWIYDPEQASPDELQRTANEPSPYSKELVKELASYGQKPTIHTVKKRRTYTPDEGINNGMWSVTLPMTSNDELKEIKGRPMDFYDCLVADSIFFLTFPFLKIPETSGFLPISSPPGSQLMADWEACASSYIVVVSDKETFQSNDSFQTWTRIRVPPGSLTDEERSSVSNVSFSHEGIFFLIRGILYIRSMHDFTRLGKNANLPDEIIGITTRKWCWDKYLLKVKDQISYIAVWTKDALYLGYEHLQFNKIIETDNLRQLLHDPNATLNIHNVEYTEHPLELALLVESCTQCNITGTVHFIIINEDTEEFLIKEFKLLRNPHTFFSMHFALSGTPDFILSDKTKIFYCYQNFADKGLLQIPIKSGHIHQVFIDYLGNFIVKLENNVMFFFKNNNKRILKLHSWTNSTTKYIIAMCPTGQIFFIHVSEIGNVYTETYPLQLEVDSVAFKIKDTCPYIEFQNDILGNTYILDKGQNLSFLIELTYPEDVGMDILMESYGPDILEIREKNSYEFSFGQNYKSKEIEFYLSENFEGVSDYFKLQYNKTGIVLFNFKPSDTASTCINPQKRVKYDWKIYGCPLKVHIKEKFQPLVQLYNEEGYVEDIDVNFIVWEIHGRKDYSFNTTMAESGCLREAQTWKSMTDFNKSLPLEDVWGPENYRHCFSLSEKREDLNQPYEIINKTNKNHLVWPMDHTGMYVFRVKILDPNYR